MSLLLDASGDNLTRTTNLPTITSFTIMGWFYRAGTGQAFTDTMLAFGDAASDPYYSLSWTVSSGKFAGWNGATGADGSITMSASTWYHCAMVCDGTGTGNFRIYINGALDVTLDGNAATTAAKLWVGTSPSGEWFNGRVASVKIYDAALTVTEIAAEMRQQVCIRRANLNSFYPMVESNLANNNNDASGNGFNLTTGGTLAVTDRVPIPFYNTQIPFTEFGNF